MSKLEKPNIICFYNLIGRVKYKVLGCQDLPKNITNLYRNHVGLKFYDIEKIQSRPNELA
jgi:hypothetical protein